MRRKWSQRSNGLLLEDSGVSLPRFTERRSPGRKHRIAASQQGQVDGEGRLKGRPSRRLSRRCCSKKRQRGQRRRVQRIAAQLKRQRRCSGRCRGSHLGCGVGRERPLWLGGGAIRLRITLGRRLYLGSLGRGAVPRGLAGQPVSHLVEKFDANRRWLFV